FRTRAYSGPTSSFTLSQSGLRFRGCSLDMTGSSIMTVDVWLPAGVGYTTTGTRIWFVRRPIVLLPDYLFVLRCGEQAVALGFRQLNLDHPAFAVGIFIHFFRTAVEQGVHFQYLPRQGHV